MSVRDWTPANVNKLFGGQVLSRDSLWGFGGNLKEKGKKLITIGQLKYRREILQGVI